MTNETNIPTCEACNGPLSEGFEETSAMSSLCDECAQDANREHIDFLAEAYGDMYFAQYDDDPNPYSGTYSEE